MLSTRNQDQENLVHAHQTAGAAKANALAPKTPHPQQHGKTPARRFHLNDENTTIHSVKGKGKDVFQTPAPRDRAPLGVKTTNAKTKPFATPAALLTNGKPLQTAQQHKTPAQQRASSRKSKLKVHHSPREVFEDDDPLSVSARPQAGNADARTDDIGNESEPEVEYCPPQPVELPDHPDPDDPLPFRPDEELTMLKPENIMRGAWDFYHNPVGDDGLTELQRKEKEWDEKAEKYIAEQERKLTERARADNFEDIRPRFYDSSEDSRSHSGSAASTKPKQTTKKMDASHRKPPGTLISKSAAEALKTNTQRTQIRSIAPAPASASTSTKGGLINRFAAPTASSKAREATTAVSTSAVGPSVTTSRQRATSGDIASRNTIGRAKGRRVSADVRGNKPTMAARTRPIIPASQNDERWQVPGDARDDENWADKSADLILQMRRDYEEEQERKRGVQGGVDALGLEALEEALNRRFDTEDGEFQLDLPEE